MTALLKTQHHEIITIPTLGEGCVTYPEIDDDAFDAMMLGAYGHICEHREEGVRISVDDLASYEYARAFLVEHFEADGVPFATSTRNDGVWRIRCEETHSLVEVRLDMSVVFRPRN